MRLLILGTGGMAAQHAKHFAAIDGVTLVGGVDVDPALVYIEIRPAIPHLRQGPQIHRAHRSSSRPRRNSAT